MKRFIICILSALAFAFAQTSCEKEPVLDPQQPSILHPLELTVSPATLTLDERQYAEGSIELAWTTGLDYGTGKELTYTLELSRTAEFDFAYTVFSRKPAVYKWQPTVDELNRLLTEELEVKAGAEAKIIARVTAHLEGSSELQQTSATFTATTYQPVTETLYLIGSATKTGWSAQQADFMTRTGNGHFTWRGYLRPGEFKFLLQLGQYTPSYNKGLDGKLLYRSSEKDPDEKFTIEEAGAYELEVDLFTRELIVQRLAEDLPPFDRLYFVGDATGWQFEPMQRDLIDPFLFRMGFTFRKAGEFKFGTEVGSWENMYKAVSQKASFKDQQTVFVKGTDPDNKWYLPESECWQGKKITFDTRPGKERMIVQPYAVICSACLAGSALPSAGDFLLDVTPEGFLEWIGQLKAGSLFLACDNASHDCRIMPAVDGKVPSGTVEPCIMLESRPEIQEVYKYVDLSSWNKSWNISEAGTYRIVLDKLHETILITRWGETLPELQEGQEIRLCTDKAVYAPGQTVTFTADRFPEGARLRYRCDGAVIRDEEAGDLTWTWTPPTEDFRGYLLEVYTCDEAGNNIIHGTIAVDVSSDWTRYPRYGFVGDFGSDKLQPGVIRKEMEYLNRCHINGVQFYDWHNKHHWPLGGTRTAPAKVWKDIANRDVYASTVRKYIEVQHQYGMKAMFYNLCNGALSDRAADGVDASWGVYKNSNGTNQDQHLLPDSWKSNIHLLDPGNAGWHEYLAARNDDVYVNFDFDGFHIDQLGDRGPLYDADGNTVWLPAGYESFIRAMKSAHPSKRLVMNAVGGFGSWDIGHSGQVDFMYNEVWDNQKEYRDLYDIIKANDEYSGHRKNTVFAAYMNYECAYRDFNEPGILMADAVMFALGGAHLELGDHMLCREYFPNQDVKMSAGLKKKIIHYYDFLTAYQYLLRSKGTVAVVNSGIKTLEGNGISEWPPQKGKITAFAKQIGGKIVIHLLNFRNVDQTSWRDLKGTMPEPVEVKNLRVQVEVPRGVTHLWLASPDFCGGAVQPLEFKQQWSVLEFTIPSLKYWDMIVIE